MKMEMEMQHYVTNENDEKKIATKLCASAMQWPFPNALHINLNKFFLEKNRAHSHI